MKLIIDIPEDITVAIGQMGLLRIPDEMIRVVDKAIQHGTPQKSGKWIPCSERLPEENKQVLIQYRTRYRDDVNLFDVTSRVDYNYWQGIGREINVIAWMPLPEPYDPQGRSDKE